ncbi:MAG: transposase [Tepidisphaeraceae bacterium]
MPNYRRAFSPGGTFFFTLVTERRQRILTHPLARNALHQAIADRKCEQPFELTAMVVLPDHLHAIWRLPDGDTDFSSRWSRIKSDFTRAWLAGGGAEAAVSESRSANRRRGVWQRRFWEHAIRDEDDFNRHVDYTHYNPVKHGHARCPHEWPWSSFHRWAAKQFYEPTWLCTCQTPAVPPPDDRWAQSLAME